MKRASLLLLGFTLLLGYSVNAQEEMHVEEKQEVKEEKYFKNTIRFNVTNPLIFGERSLVLGYERIIKENQSFSINIGQAGLPKLISVNIDTDSTVQIDKSTKSKGFNITGDYRFYLGSVNKYAAPRGIYIGPYASFVTMGRENTWSLNTDNHQGELKSDLNLEFASVGFQLGYQFVFWKRFALDLVLIGPGVAWYNLEAKFDTDLKPEDEEALYEKINEVLSEKFPGYNFVFDGVEFKKTGTTNTTSIGYRYVVHLGFRF